MALGQGQAQSSMRVIPKAAAAGRSGAFFFVSPDQRFLLKSMSPTEHRLMLRLLQPYTEHLAEARLSLLPRYVGLYTLSLPGKRTRRFVALANFFAGLQPIARRCGLKGLDPPTIPHPNPDPNTNPSPKLLTLTLTSTLSLTLTLTPTLTLTRYDLKGSTHGRSASAAEQQKGRFAVYKDGDFKQEGRRLHLAERAAATLEALRKDVALLRAHRLIDYSLLVGIHVAPSSAAAPVAAVSAARVAMGGRGRRRRGAA